MQHPAGAGAWLRAGAVKVRVAGHDGHLSADWLLELRPDPEFEAGSIVRLAEENEQLRRTLRDVAVLASKPSVG